MDNYMSTVKSQINKNTLLIIDNSDITKDYTTKTECIATVRDGSTGEYKMGYHTIGITALTPKKKMPIPVYNHICSATEDGYISEDEEVIKGLKYLSKSFSKDNIRAFDRGYDNNRYYEYLIKKRRKIHNKSKEK